MKLIRSSISIQFVLLAFLSISLTAIFTGIMSYRAASNSMVEKLRTSDILKITELKAINIEERLKRAVETSTILSQNSNLIQWLDSDRAPDSFLIESLKIARYQFDYSYVGVVREKDRNHYFLKDSDLIESYPIQEGVGGSEWYFRFISQKIPVEFKLDYNPIFQRAYIFSNQLIRSGDKILGAYSIGIDFSQVARELLREDSFHGESWLISRDGTIQVSQNLDEVDKNVSSIFPESIAKDILNLQSSEIRLIETSNEKDTYFYSMYNLKIVDWIIIYRINYSEITKPLISIRTLTILGGSISAFIAMIAFYSISHRITSPIVELTNYANRIALKGDFDHSIQIHSEDEVGKLAKTFNIMSIKLKELYQNLDNLVQLRTQELSQTNQSLQISNQKLSDTLSTLEDAHYKLIEKEKMAALGTLIAGISHEINTPIGAIHSSNTLISEILNKELDGIFYTFRSLDEETLHLISKLISESRAGIEILPFSKSRSLRNEIKIFLTDNFYNPSEEDVNRILDLGWINKKEDLLILLQNQNFSILLNKIYQLVLLKNSSEVINTAVLKASAVIKTLRNYISEKGHETMTTLSLRDELESILVLYQSKFKSGIQLEKKFVSPGMIYGNKERLSQVWINLLNNSIQAIHDKKENGKLTLGIEESDSEIKISFHDNGYGIPPEIQNRIFEPFFSTKSSGEGMGIGLDIVKKILDFHDARIHFESKPGDTCFRIDFQKLKSAS
ncbi:MAG: HAMP domain-containing protein [Leptospiraceae bacterium]|nr:HAMP domain-containing protein [Leptospiraceae bacterium]